MPNWITNRMTVLGDADEVERFLKANGGGVEPKEGAEKDMCRQEVLSFACLRPMPEDLPDAAWGDWCCDSWGCKWDAMNSTVKKIEGGLEYVFQTPWSPPYEWFNWSVGPEFKQLDITLRWMDEDIPRCGQILSPAGTFSDETDVEFFEDENFCRKYFPEEWAEYTGEGEEEDEDEPMGHLGEEEEEEKKSPGTPAADAAGGARSRLSAGESPASEPTISPAGSSSSASSSSGRGAGSADSEACPRRRSARLRGLEPDA